MPRAGYIGASEIAALFNLSPYNTRWDLWSREAKGRALAEPDDERLRWGSLLQDDILAEVAHRMKWSIEPNAGDAFVTHPGGLQLGATVDAWVRDHEEGPGLVECKNVDWFIHRQTWSEDAA